MATRPPGTTVSTTTTGPIVRPALDGKEVAESVVAGEILIGRFRQGDREAFTELYRAHQPAVFRFAFHMVGDRFKAAEITQDVFVWLVHHADHFDPGRGSLPAFLTGVARRLLQNRLRAERRWFPLKPAILWRLRTQDTTPDFARAIDADALRTAIALLPLPYREAIVLCDLESRSYDEAAAILCCAAGHCSITATPGAGVTGAQISTAKGDQQMTCKAARAGAIEHIRSGAPLPDAHLRTCPECARFYQTQLALQPAFSALACEVPESVLDQSEGAILAELDSAARLNSRPTPRRLGWGISVGAAALGAVLIFGWVTTRAPTSQHSIPIQPNTKKLFVQIPYTAPLAPCERTRIVRLEMPLAALIAAGFEVHTSDAGATLPVDVLFGQDGRAHAIRPVLVSDLKRRVVQ